MENAFICPSFVYMNINQYDNSQQRENITFMHNNVDLSGIATEKTMRGQIMKYANQELS